MIMYTHHAYAKRMQPCSFFSRWNLIISTFFFSIVALCASTQAAHATNTSITVSTTSTEAGATADWTIQFTAPATIPSGTMVNFYLPANWSASPTEYFDASSASLTSQNGTLSIGDYGYLSITTNTAYTVGDAVAFEITGIQNVSTAGTYQLTGNIYDENYNYYYLISNSVVVGTILVQGEVVHPDTQAGIEGVSVFLYCINSYGSASATTDANGAFTLAGDLSGTCEISFSYYDSSGTGLQAPAKETITLSGQTVDRTGENAFEMLVPNITTTLQTPSGEPVSGAWGWVYYADWSYYYWFSTSADGMVNLALSQSGTYTIEFDISNTAYAAEYVTPAKTTFTYTADPESHTLPASIELQTPTVSATILKPDGTPAPDYTYVYLYNTHYSVWEWAGTKNGTGIVTFAVDPGEYTIEVDWIGYDSLNPTAMYIA